MKNFLVIILLVICQLSYGQADYMRQVQLIPSPNSAGLVSDSDGPTSLLTGKPGISVPILQAGSRQLSVPISLHYNASGRKVNEMSTWVGLGWSLNCSGVITRVMRGLPDESPNGFLANAANTIPDATDPIGVAAKTDIAEGVVDMTPDVFYVKAGGLAGKILLR